MRWNAATPISVLTGLVGAICARPVLATEPARCAPMVVKSDASLLERWPDLPGQVRAALEMRGDVDTCARIGLSMSGATIVVRVALPDGRAAVRSVLRREDVLPALEGLLLLPKDAASGASKESGSTTLAPEEVQAKAIVPAVRMDGDGLGPAKSGAGAGGEPPRISTVDRTDAAVAQRILEPSMRPPADALTHLRVDLSLATGARVGDGHMGVGLGLASFLELAHWLLGFQSQLNLYQPIGAGDLAQPMAEAARSVALELGLLGGRRFRLRMGTLDLAAGPALALHGTRTSVTQQAATGTALSQTSSDGGLPRMVVSSRLSFGRRSSLRSFVEADGEIGRTGASSDPLSGAPRLPAWTIGLAVGAVVGTP